MTVDEEEVGVPIQVEADAMHQVVPFLVAEASTILVEGACLQGNHGQEA